MQQYTSILHFSSNFIKHLSVGYIIESKIKSEVNTKIQFIHQAGNGKSSQPHCIMGHSIPNG